MDNLKPPTIPMTTSHKEEGQAIGSYKARRQKDMLLWFRTTRHMLIGPLMMLPMPNSIQTKWYGQNTGSVKQVQAVVLKDAEWRRCRERNHSSSSTQRIQRLHLAKTSYKKLTNSGKLNMRPVSSWSGSPIERLAEMVDFYINPEIRKMDSFGKDSKDVLRRIMNFNENVTLPTTTDICSLLMWRPCTLECHQHLGIEGVRKALVPSRHKRPSTANLIECFNFKGMS